METIIIKFIAGAILFAIGFFIAELLLHIILRQLKQKKPCKYCDGSLTTIGAFRGYLKTADIFISNNSLVSDSVSYDRRIRCIGNINYCPMCGRKLKEK